jgi:hypothetical protein
MLVAITMLVEGNSTALAMGVFHSSRQGLQLLN